MNRGYDGKTIFAGNKYKNQFLEYLEDSSQKMKIRLLAYCVMDNHYHLVLENASGRMSDFLRLLNGQYGMHYRKMAGGKGYVFQSRFKSTLSENDSYLVQSILYLLRNPVRAGIVQLPEDYIWSSAKYYFSDKTVKFVDQAFVAGLFNSKEEFLSALNGPTEKELPVVITKYGELMGGDGFLESALKRFERRKKPTSQSRGVRRKDEQYFNRVFRACLFFMLLLHCRFVAPPSLLKNE
jgi:REP element-mobilizing transposase RayT